MVTADAGWQRIGPDPAIAAWAEAALAAARAALDAPDGDWRCGGTWFAGIDALPNGVDGGIGGVPFPSPLHNALPFTPQGWHKAQLSVTRPGYPRRASGEAEPAFRYRLTRDAAHVDGLLAIGPDRRRMLREPHAFVLGLPLTWAAPEAAPLAVWQGSHRVVGRAFAAALGPHPPADWPEIDLTDIYHAARREVFATCARITLPAQPGEALVLHRHLLHGTAPWADGARAAPEGRAIAWFRPEFPDRRDWIDR